MRALYTAATGMTAQQMRIDNIANNLSNVSTTGFKKSRESFEDLVYQDMAVGNKTAEAERPTNLQVGTGTRLSGMSRDFKAGDLTYTGNELDLAIGGRGFFVLEDPNGAERYTRDGRFTKNADGELVNGGGLTLSPGIQVPSDAQMVVISEDGSVQVQYPDQTEVVTVGQVQLVDFVNPAGLRSVGGNLYQATPESGEPVILDPSEGHVNIQQGFTESSNVDVAEELINMIMAQRAFELTSKVIQGSDEMMQTVSNLKR